MRVFVESIIIGLSWLLAYWVRFDFSIPEKYYTSIVASSLILISISLLVLTARGSYKNIWKYTSYINIKNDVLNIASILLLSIIVLFYVKIDPVVPRTVHLLGFIFSLIQLYGIKLLVRYFTFSQFSFEKRDQSISLIVGAGERGRRVSFDLINKEAVLGFVDDDLSKSNKQINGIDVLGIINDIETIIQQYGVLKVYLAIKEIDSEKLNFIINVCSRNDVEIDVSTFDNLSGGQAVNFKKLDIEYLLGREPANIDVDELKTFIEGKTIFISGAGGSIGSEICRQLVTLNPKKIIAFDLSEYAIYALSENIDQLGVKLDISYLVGDVTNDRLIDCVFKTHQPEIVYHAAAYKHVPLLEKDNSWAGIYNNVLGTYNLSRMAIAHAVENFILISTDKAVEPSNVMGATKRASEIICSSFNHQAKTLFNIVRFGNVIGSSGSVIPKFIDQIKLGGPITVTHPDVTRYFMSIPEAAKLVIHASSMKISNAIFILDMGKPVKIKEIAHNLIKFFNALNVEVVYTGLRPGEKLHEILIDDEKVLNVTHNLKIKYQQLNSVNQQSKRYDVLQLISNIHPMEDQQNRLELFKFIESNNHD